ncbi:MAG: hypothetical protein ABIZ49_07120, partial [Opitutaceae bacterium]
MRSAKREAGFALLITITLLAFLVILLVGLAAYTRVETAVVGNTQRQAQARENALLGLNVALAQLQKHAGPDQRVTATAEAFPNAAGTSHYTGVWDTTATGPDAQTWLVSGNETNPLAVKPDATPVDPQELVGIKTSGVTNDVRAKLMPITAVGGPGIPSTASPPVIGRYAWWIGDQGVKAPVAIADRSAAVNYAPYGDGAQQLDLGKRIGQQIALGAGAVDGNGAPVFEPRDNNNVSLVANQKVVAPAQIAFLRSPANAVVGLTRVQQNYHAWSPNNFAVLADSMRGGLREDLSLVPQRLGSAFSAWARYELPRAVAMEPIVPGTGPLPPYGDDPLRRRYLITTNIADGGVEGGIHPVLSFFGLSFSIRASSAPNYEVSVRCVVGLWNPHSSALVPPSGDNNRLELHITGLPEVRVQDSLGGNATVPLQTLMGGPLRFVLAWPDQPLREDEASWLPGRVHYWSAESNTAEPPAGNAGVFNERNPTLDGDGVVRSAGIAHQVGPPGVKVYRRCLIENDTILQVTLVRPRNQQQETLATFESPPFRRFSVDPSAPVGPESLETDQKFVDFAFVFRLPDSAEIPEGESAPWLSAPSRDPRRSALPGSAFVAGQHGPQPELYGGPGVTGFATDFPSRLLDRATDSHDYNEDVSVFELPRGPFLSVGALQHLIIPSARPFAIGNSWGAGINVNGVPANALFDRFFFSGLAQDVVPAATATGDLILPNPLLKPLRKPDATKVTIDDIRGTGNQPAAASKFFLQGGAFNVNSTSPTAWAAVLRSVRFPAPSAFDYLDVDTTTGTASTTGETVATVQSSDAQFFRFSQSAQETYKA